MSSSTISSVLKALSELNQPIHVTGVTQSSFAFLLTRLIDQKWGHPNAQEVTPVTLILCPNEDSVTELTAQLECLSPVFGETTLQVYSFPTWEPSPYSPVTLSLRTRLSRLNTLSALLQKMVEKAPPVHRVIVTTQAALCQSTLPPAEFEQASVKIEVNQEISSREALTSRLIEGGYLRVDTVEDPGTFAVRGDIIDVFPTDRLSPLRIELFGESIEKIRAFDPATQRAASDDKLPGIMKIRIPPAREVLINPATTSTLRERLKAYSDDVGISRINRDPILFAIQNGAYPDHSEAWAPFAYSKTATLWDYLTTAKSSDSSDSPKAQPRVVILDEMGCEQEWKEFLTEQKEAAQDAIEAQRIVPPIEELFAWTPDLQAKLKEYSILYFDKLVLGDEGDQHHDPHGDRSEDQHGDQSKAPAKTQSTTHHRMSVEGNKSLVRGTRHSLGELEPQFRLWNKQGYRVVAVAATQSQLERMRFLLEERGLVCQMAAQSEGPPKPSLITLALGFLTEGFRWPSEGLVVLTEDEILGTHHAHKERRKPEPHSGSSAKDWSGLQALSDLAVGDAVVHIDHGIGRYQGISRLSLSGAPSDFLILEYSGKDRLYLPVYRLNVIQKYVGPSEGLALDRLGTLQFQKTKDKVRNAVKKLAFDLVQLYAERKIRPGIRFSPRDAAFREFEGSFPFDETPDQLTAIDAVLADMESGKVMDRLVCGDVGYGKTEVAIRAAFRAVSDGKQAAVLVPTTILAQQHELSFKSRMKDYPIIIESLSRFKTKREQQAILENLAKGKVDIVVGTHRLLSKDIRFQDLGILIVDEEHRFGVEHKEKLKTLKVNTHVLTLTATPIPRTLHMSLSGLRDISLINTPPVDRLPIRTYVSKFDEGTLKKAIEFELSRGGQVFYLHNRVQTIFEAAKKIRELVPSAQVIVAHGQMPESELEATMSSFYQKKANVLVCTTIIESGLDLPLANTILVVRADTLGLAQLYQIRGRVGRGQQRAYAYLFIPEAGEVTPEAKQRLEVIQRFVELGSGFSIASHDLEIRGGGDLLGPQQSGNIAAVGFDLYTELLEEAIHEIQGKPLAPEDSRREPEIKVPFPAYLSEEFVPDVHQRLSLYRRFSAAVQDTDIDRLEEELRDRFGSLPVEAQNLLWLVRIKTLLKRVGIDALTVGPEKVSLLPGPGSKLNPVRAIALISAHPQQYQLMPDSKLVAKIPTGTLRDLFFGLETLFKEFSVEQ